MKLDISFRIDGLPEKTDLVNKAIEHLLEADRLLEQANQICFEVAAEVPEQLREEPVSLPFDG